MEKGEDADNETIYCIWLKYNNKDVSCLSPEEGVLWPWLPGKPSVAIGDFTSSFFSISILLSDVEQIVYPFSLTFLLSCHKLLLILLWKLNRLDNTVKK